MEDKGDLRAHMMLELIVAGGLRGLEEERLAEVLGERLQEVLLELIFGRPCSSSGDEVGQRDVVAGDSR